MIKLITGVMNSGKSERLIEEIEKCSGSYLILKPSQDTRDGAKVRTRAHSRTHDAVLVDEDNRQVVKLVLNSIPMYRVIFIDEVQFFSKSFIARMVGIANYYGIDIITSGLTRNFKGEKFPSMTVLWNEVERENTEILFGECWNCGSDEASVVVLMDKADSVLTEGETVQIEGQTDNHYENLCDICHEAMK